MKATELRIGNFIKLCGLGEPMDVCVLGVEQDKVYYNRFLEIEEKTDFFKALYCYCKGISIAEEWLIKFGFSNNNNTCLDICVDKSHGEHHEGFYIIRVMKHDNGWWVILNENKGMSRGGINLGTFHYIHQIQNIVFDLTQKELSFKN